VVQSRRIALDAPIHIELRLNLSAGLSLHAVLYFLRHPEHHPFGSPLSRRISMQTLLQDLRYAVRQLRMSPGFTVTAVLTLALGVGATTAIFSCVYGLLLKSLPFREADSLVVLSETHPRFRASRLPTRTTRTGSRSKVVLPSSPHIPPSTRTRCRWRRMDSPSRYIA
jgi:hypothetical protein